MDDRGYVPVDALLDVPATPVEADIIDKLVTSYPRAVTRSALLEHVYAFRKEPASRVLPVHISRLRKALPRWGWTIVTVKGGSGRGCHGHYRLDPVTRAEAPRPLIAPEHAPVVTGSHPDATGRFAGRPVISSVSGVLDLKNGTPVVLDDTCDGSPAASPVVLARALVKRNILREVTL